MNSRKLAADLVAKILENKAYSNIALSKALNESNLIDKDKALVTEIVYGTIKYQYTIDTILNYLIKKGLKSLESFIANVLRTSIYQIRYLDKIPDFAVVNEAVNLSKKYSGIGASKLVNGVLRSYLRNKEDTVFYDNQNFEEQLCFKYSFHRWMVKLFLEQYGTEKCELILKGLNQVPSVVVRVNCTKGTYDEAFDLLQKSGYNVKEGCVCPEAINIMKGRNVENNPLFIEGKITVQDESAMLTAVAMDIKENQIIMDLCSAPGGKTTHIGELLNNTGEVRAFDIYENKLKLIEENVKRLALTNIKCSMMDATVLNSEYLGFADKVLMDVPCSGLGIIRKKPEIKWTKAPGDLKELVDIQRKIMSNGALYLKDQGEMLYSTCTLNKEENEENINWFLKNHTDFIVQPLYFGDIDNIIYHNEGYATILPNKEMDGFFIAKLRKNKQVIK